MTPAFADQRHRGVGLDVLVVDAEHRDPVAVFVVELLRGPAAPCGTGRTRSAHRLTTIGPRRRDRSTSEPPPRQGRVTSGRPPSTAVPSPGSQSARRRPSPWPAQLGRVDVDLARPGPDADGVAVGAVQPEQRAASTAASTRAEGAPHARPSVRTSAAALDRVGRALAVRRAPAARPGTRRRRACVAWQTRRPCQIRWWLSIVQSRLGNSAPIGVLDLDRVGLVGPAEPAGQPAEVGVDGDAGDAEGVAEHHVGGLAAHAGQRDQVLEAGRHLAVVPLDERLAQLEQRLGLGPEEAERADDLLEVVARRPPAIAAASG